MKKTLLLIASAAIYSTNFTQGCTDLYFSEYIEGSSSNKALEIYNPTNAAIDLSNYSVERFNNGGTSPSGTITLNGMLNAGEVYVIGNSNADAAILAQADTTHSITFFNGDDALTLKNGATVIDAFGEVGVDPGSGWTVGTGATNNYTLIRKVTVNAGNTTWAGSGDLEWDVQPIDNFTFLGSHTANGCGAQSTDPIISFDGFSTSVSESVGTITIDLTLTNQSANATSVDVVVNASSTAMSGDYTFTNPTTVTFPANSTANQTISIVINDDVDVESMETIVLDLQNFTNNATAGTYSTYEIEINDNDEPVIAGCSELYFSEYIEGSSSNKAIEIYNPTSQAVDLSNYTIYRYNNGATTPSDTLMMTGMLTAGDVFIAAHPSADSANVRAHADTLHSITYYNGDDALALYNGTTQVDVIGVIGVDPGSSWSVDTGATQNYTLVRKPTIVNGTILWSGNGDTQWTAYSIDDFSHLGMHTTNGCASMPVSTPMVNTDTVCLGTAFSFSENSTGGVAPYTYNWDFGDGNTSSMANPTHTYASAGTYTVTLWITESSMLGQVDDSTLTVVVDPCSSVEESLVNTIEMYPNPTKDGMVQFSNIENNTTVTVYNLVGAVVYNTIINNAQSIDFSNLNKGSYVVSLTTNNKSAIKKLIIE